MAPRLLLVLFVIVGGLAIAIGSMPVSFSEVRDSGIVDDLCLGANIEGSDILDQRNPPRPTLFEAGLPLKSRVELLVQPCSGGYMPSRWSYLQNIWRTWPLYADWLFWSIALTGLYMLVRSIRKTQYQSPHS